mgnify:CR=1 FL=1
MGFGQIETITHGGANLAFERQTGAGPTFVWLGGYRSDMAGTKAGALAEWARERGQGFLRFDYSGHGRSGGQFEDGTIGAWLSDTLAVLDRLTEGPLVLIGSSMGGWLALLAARARPERIAGLLLIAPAADFTERLMWPGLSAQDQRTLMQVGRLEQPSAYSEEPNVITRALIEDGRKHLIMDAPIRFSGPVRILQGEADPDVPTAHVRELAALIEPQAEMRVLAGGDHRLSRAEDIDALIETAQAMAEALAR